MIESEFDITNWPLLLYSSHLTMVQRQKFNQDWRVSRFQRLFPNPSWLVWGRASHRQKLAPTFPWWLNGIFSKWKCHHDWGRDPKMEVSLMVVYLMLLEAAVHTFDWSWKKMDIKLMMMITDYCYFIYHTTDSSNQCTCNCSARVGLVIPLQITLSQSRRYIGVPFCIDMIFCPMFWPV